ncbi:unnamed protein product [Gadus morhua 'NCC']
MGGSQTEESAPVERLESNASLWLSGEIQAGICRRCLLYVFIKSGLPRSILNFELYSVYNLEIEIIDITGMGFKRIESNK